MAAAGTAKRSRRKATVPGDFALREDRLWAAYLQSRSAENENALAEIYLPYVHKSAWKYHNSLPSSVDRDDLIQGASIALLDCIRRFNPRRRVRFLSFAYRRLHGAMVDVLRKQDFVPRLDRQRCEPDGFPVTHSIGLAVQERADGTRMELGATIHDDTATGPGNAADVTDWWHKLSAGLSEHERLVLTLYYREQLTMKVIGERIGLSESRIAQMRKDILRRLKCYRKKHDFTDISDKAPSGRRTYSHRRPAPAPVARKIAICPTP